MVLVVHLLLPLLSGGRSNHCQESQRQVRRLAAKAAGDKSVDV
jgi:hypothetical protein